MDRMWMLLITLLAVSHALAGNQNNLVFSGRIVKPNNAALESTSVQFNIAIYSPNSCLLYSETQIVNMTDSGGTFSLNLGSGTRTDGGAHTFTQVFANTGSFSGLTGTGCSGSYSPARTDDRTLVLQFNDGTGVQTLSPQAVKAVPFASNTAALQGVPVNLAGTLSNGQILTYDSVANEWKNSNPATGAVTSVAGKTGVVTLQSADITDATSSNTPNTIVLRDANGNFQAGTISANLVGNVTGNVTGNISGTSAGFTGTLAGDVIGAQGTTSVIKIQGRNVSSAAPNSNDVLSWNGTAWVPAALPGGGVTNVGLALPAEFTVTNSPVSSAGTLTGAWASQTQGYVFAAPKAANGVPTFRKFEITDLFSNAGGSFLTGSSCTAGQALIYTSATDTISCAAITSAVSNAATLSNAKIWVGDAANKAQEVSVAGDATLSNLGTLTLANSGVTAGTYPKVTVDAKGRVTASGTLAVSDVSGIAHVQGGNSFGMTGTIGTADNFGFAVKTNNTVRITVTAGGSVGIGVAAPTVLLDVAGEIKLGNTALSCAVGTAGSFRYNAGTMEFCNGAAWTPLASGGSGEINTASNQGLSGVGLYLAKSTYDLQFKNIDKASGSPVTVTNNAGNKTVDLDVSATSGQLLVGNASNLARSVAMSGDATITNLGTVTVSKIQGSSISSTAPSNGQVLTWNNGTSQWEPTNAAATGVTNVMAGAGLSSNPAGGIVSVGSLAIDTTYMNANYFKQGGNSFGTTGTLGTADNNSLVINTNNAARVTVLSTGEVGIGTVPVAGDSLAVAEELSFPAAFNSIIKNTGGAATNSIRLYDSGGQITIRSGQGTTGELGVLSAINLTNYYNNVVAFKVTPAAGQTANLVQVDTNKLVVTSGGSIGVGVGSPAAKLDVSGEIKLGNTSLACAVGTAGSFRYNAGTMEFCNGAAWTALAAGGSGEVNTGSNVGTAGVGVFDAKTVFDLQFRNINAATGAPVTVTLDAPNKEIDLDIASNSGQILVGNASNLARSVAMSGDATITNLGTVTVGKIQNRAVSASAPSGGQLLTWNNGLSQWEPGNAPATGVTSIASGTGMINNPSTIVGVGTVAVDAGLGIGKIPQVGGTAIAAESIVMANSTGSLIGKTCSVNEVLQWNATTWTCVSVSSLVGSTSWAQGGNSFGMTGTLGTSDNNDLVLKTNNASRMTITSGGSVGIGTNTPGRKLDVQGSAYLGTTTDGKLSLSTDWAGSGEAPTGVLINNSGSGGLSILAANTGASGSKVVVGYFNQTNWFSALEVANVASGYGNLLLMKTGGNVGIGTTTPVDKLSFGAPTASATKASINLSNTALVSGNANGTYIGANPASATADFMRYQVAGSDLFRVSEWGDVYIGNLGARGSLDIAGMAAPGVSTAGQGRIYFDSTLNKFRVSQNGGAYADLVSSGGGSSSGAAGFLQFSNGSGGFSSDSTVGGQLYWDSAAHRLGIGTGAPGVDLEVRGSGIVDIYSTNNANLRLYGFAAQAGGLKSGNTSGVISLHSPNDLRIGIDNLNSSTGRVIKFLNNIDTAGESELMRIQDDGKVGIANSSPSALFEVGTSGASGQRLTINAELGSTTAGLQILNTTGDSSIRLQTTTGLYSLGSDESDSGKFKISRAGGLGSSDSFAITTAGKVAIGGATANVGLDLSAIPDSVRLPSGNTAARPGTPVNGDLRYNSQTNKFEGYENGGWANLIGSGGVSGSGTTGRHSKFTAASTVGDGLISDDGTNTISFLNSSDSYGVELFHNAGGPGNTLRSRTVGTTLSFQADRTNGTNFHMFDGGTNLLGYGSSSSANLRISDNGGIRPQLQLDNTNSGTWDFIVTNGGTLGGSLQINSTAGVILTNRAIASSTNTVSAAAVDLTKSNTHTLATPGTSTITVSGMQDGGMYNIVVADTANSRTYTFSGCTNSYFKPANAATTVGTRTVYGLLTVKNGANWDCYITWSTGFQ